MSPLRHCHMSAPLPRRAHHTPGAQALQIRHIPPNAPGAPHPVPAASISIRAKAPYVLIP